MMSNNKRSKPNFSDDVVLSYHDSIIKTSDLCLLDGPEWLNDRIIGFYFEYLSVNIAPEDWCFMGPEVSQFVKMSEPGNDMDIFVKPLNLKKTFVLICAVNDNLQPFNPGGSHWSLLVYLRGRNCHPDRFKHYDSSSIGYNSQSARALAVNLCPYLGAHELNFENVLCSKQNNSYDCGMYLLAFAKLLCDEQIDKQDVDWQDVSPTMIAAVRLELKRIILSCKPGSV